MPEAGVPVAETAPAKINLALHVTGRRDDGYHLLESLVVFTGFGDRVTVSPAARDLFEISGPFGRGLAADDGNLAVRARDALRAALTSSTTRSFAPPSVLPDISPSKGEISSSAFGDKLISPLRGEMSGRTEGGNVERFLSQRVVHSTAIHLEKNLPVASGIGGGSSDAAATLIALNRFWNVGLTIAELAEIGLPLGADVPMCLVRKPLIAGGIGEWIEPVASFPALPIVLVNPGASVSTPRIFAAMTIRENPPLPKLQSSVGFKTLLGWLRQTRNDLMTPALSLEPRIGEALAALTSQNAAFVRMSGSGATCFGLYADVYEARRASAAIRAAQPDWFVVATQTGAASVTERN